jgi:hypothetical protein
MGNFANYIRTNRRIKMKEMWGVVKENEKKKIGYVRI